MAPRGTGPFVMANRLTVTRIADGTYLVVTGEAREIVYVAGPAGRRSAFWRGRVYESTAGDAKVSRETRPGERGSHVLTAPMPATVIKVLVAPGTHVRKG